MRIKVPFFKKLKRKIRESLGIKKKQKFAPLPTIGPFSLKRVAAEEIFIKAASTPPKASIIIADGGQIEPVLNCLAAIADDPPRCAPEVLIAVNRSDDGRLAVLRRIAGVKLIELPGELGLAERFNLAAKQAEGQYLCFLGNGLVPLACTIDALVDFAENTPNAGMVGARPLDPGGAQKNAGGIVWNDASCCLFGPNDDPMKPEYQYVREVDYLPGASFLVPGQVWRDLGGFDATSIWNGCENVDFAFRVRSLGKCVYFQPAANVVSFNGDSSEGGGVCPSRWSATLAAENYPPQQGSFRARERAKNRQTILIVDHHAPEPDRDAGSRTIIEFIRSFQGMGWIVKYWPQNLKYHSVYVPALQQLGVEILYGPHETSLADWLKRNGDRIDVVLLSRPSIALELLGDIRTETSATVLYYGHDLHFARWRLEAKVTGKDEPVRLAKDAESVERELWRKVDAVLYPTDEEIDEVNKREPGVSAHAVPAYCFETLAERKTAPSGKSILFVAGFEHPPNVDAAIWFVEKIFPLVRRIHPDAVLSLVGSNPKPKVRKLAGQGVEVAGWVSADELRSRYSTARLAVVPLRFGAGIKLKVVEALVAGVPLVTTSIGAQGLQGLEGVCFIEDEADAFASAVVRSLGANDADWLTTSRRQGDYIAGKFSRDCQIESLRAAVKAGERVKLSRAKGGAP